MTELWVEKLDKKWNLQYAKLVDFQTKNGHCKVPSNYKQDKALGKWVNLQQNHHTRKILLFDRKELLDKIGFGDRKPEPSAQDLDKQWNLQYEKLVELKRKNGHCRMPHRYDPDRPLGRWANAQRTFHSNNELRLDRKELLDKIEFVWISQSQHLDNQWNLQYEKLVEFKRKNGHCAVTSRYEQDKSLRMWVKNQRQYLINKRLRSDRKAILDEIGFIWRVDDGDDDNHWVQQYQKLVEMKGKHGNDTTPFNYRTDTYLLQWVAKQRHFHNNNKLQHYRKELLDEIGLIWNVEDHATTQFNSLSNNKLRQDPKALLDSEAFASRSVGLPNEAIEETEPAQYHIRNRFEYPSLANRERLRTCLAENAQIIAARTNERDNTTGDCSSVEEGDGCDGENPSPFLETTSCSSVQKGSDPHQEVVQEHATRVESPSGWTRVRLEPSPTNIKRPRTCLAESGQVMAARTNERYNSVEKDDGDDEEDSSPSLVTTSTILRIGYDPDQQAVQLEAAPDAYLPPGWTRTKLEPDF